jgi:hypothetical protein
MVKNCFVVANAVRAGHVMTAEFDLHTGRLRILDGVKVQAEWLPPHSWFAIASVAGRSHWGTKPTEADLRLVLDSVVHQ